MKRLCIFIYILQICLAGTIAQNNFRRFTVADGLQNNQVRQIVELPNGQILVNTEGVFSLFNGQYFITLPCNLDSIQPLPEFGGHGYLWQGDSLLWLKDYYSLYLFDTRSRKFRYDYPSSNRPNTLDAFIREEAHTISSKRKEWLNVASPLYDSLTQGTPMHGEPLQAYCKDRQGGHWFGLRNGGIIYMSPHYELVKLLKPERADIFRRMCSINGKFMLVAGEKGIYEYDCHQHRITKVLVQGNINASEMIRDNMGRIWTCTNQGIYCYENGEMTIYNSSNTQGFVHDNMRFVLPLDNQRMLVCNFMHQLGYLYPDEKRFENLNEKFDTLNNYRTMIVATPLANKNHIAVCTQNGFFIWDVAHDRILESPLIQSVSSHSRKYNCILHDRAGRLWIGTQNGLLFVENKRIRRITRQDGLSNECIQSLAEDAKGNIWVGTSSGINRISTESDIDNIRIRSLGEDDGIPDIEMTERGICVMPDSNIYLATQIGMITFPTQPFHEHARPDSLVLVGLNVAGEAMSLDTLPLRLSYRQNYIDLQASTLNYARPKQSRYRYRLLGLDTEWHNALYEGEMTAIRYNALAPGDYTMEVQASTGDNLWGPTLRKKISIATPLWLSWWAKLIYVCSAILLISTIMRMYFTHRQKRMERENEERVNQLFELRYNAHHQFAQSIEINSEAICANSEEEKFVELMMQAISQNMSNCDYTVDLMARDIGMSRANLYKKMQTMLGVTPNDFIRNVRLKHAAKLLAETSIPINQISLDVGFQTPRYFSMCFRKIFGVTPSEYRNGK